MPEELKRLRLELAGMRRERAELLHEIAIVRKNMDHALRVVERAIDHSDRSSLATFKFMGLMINHLYSSTDAPPLSQAEPVNTDTISQKS
jgi:hypothetical protein